MIKIKKKIPLIDQHDKYGFYGGKFGGNYCAETLRKPIEDLSKLFEKLRKSKKFLKKRDHPHVLTLSPPIDLNDKWFFPHLAYTMSKMSMSLCTLGHAREFKKYGIGVNSLWRFTAIDTSAVRNILGGREIAMRSRKPTIMADAAIEILKKSPVEFTGNFLIDELVLRECGYNDFQKYLISDEELIRDFFIPDEIGDSMLTKTTSIYK